MRAKGLLFFPIEKLKKRAIEDGLKCKLWMGIGDIFSIVEGGG